MKIVIEEKDISTLNNLIAVIPFGHAKPLADFLNSKIIQDKPVMPTNQEIAANVPPSPGPVPNEAP